jgi:hypothetical protein
MKIEARCETCERRFLLSQIGPESDAPGRCPFCGARFGRHYTTILPDAVRTSEAAAAALVVTLGRLQAIETGFDIDVEGFLADLGRAIREHEQQPAAS